MPSFLVFLIISWLVGMGLSAGLHRVAKVKIPPVLAIILGSCSFLAVGLIIFIFLWGYVPDNSIGMLAATVLGSWFFLSAFHLWFYTFFKIEARVPVYPWAVLQALLLLAIHGALVIGMIIGLFAWESRCYSQRQSVMVFTGHLKSLCVEHKGSGLCPQDEDSLKAFNPPLYKSLNTCAFTSYEYDADTERFKWVVQFSDQRMFADPENLPGIGIPPRD